jgi:hypothetical protein
LGPVLPNFGWPGATEGTGPLGTPGAAAELTGPPNEILLEDPFGRAGLPGSLLG